MPVRNFPENVLKFSHVHAKIRTERENCMLEGNTKVQINKTENIQVQAIADSAASSRKPKAGNTSTDDLRIDSKSAEYVSQALENQDDTRAIEEAKKLLQSGALESPESIRAAAENILKFGI
jgi:putative cell wall-binding protein